MIDTITGIDHQGLIRSREDIDAPSAGHLETEKIDARRYRKLLDVSIKVLSCCGTHGSAG